MGKKIFVMIVIALFYCFIVYPHDSQSLYQQHSFYQTYEGIVLTPETVAKLAQSEPFTIKDQKLISWLKKHKKLLITLASHIVYSQTKSIKKRIRAGNRLLKKYKLKNKGVHNFVFCMSTGTGGKKYWIKIAGPHRFRQLSHLKKMVQSSRECKALYANRPIYHNASRFARYILYKKWASQEGVLPIKVPTTYLFTLSDKGLIDDNYCIIIEEDVGSSVVKRCLVDALLGMENEIKQFVINTALWDSHLAQFVMTDKGEIFCIDLEDSNSTTPDMFFHQNYEAIKKDINTGLYNVQKMFSLIK